MLAQNSLLYNSPTLRVIHVYCSSCLCGDVPSLMQEEYYATHQCFLSRRSLYLVVWRVTDGRRGVEELKPWLLNIQVAALQYTFLSQCALSRNSTSENLT